MAGDRKNNIDQYDSTQFHIGGALKSAHLPNQKCAHFKNDLSVIMIIINVHIFISEKVHILKMT